MAKFQLPEKGPILYNGVRQYMLEDLDLLLAYEREIAYHDTVVRLTEEPARRRHLSRLYRKRLELQSAFLAKWDKAKEHG